MACTGLYSSSGLPDHGPISDRRPRGAAPESYCVWMIERAQLVLVMNWTVNPLLKAVRQENDGRHMKLSSPQVRSPELRGIQGPPVGSSTDQLD